MDKRFIPFWSRGDAGFRTKTRKLDTFQLYNITSDDMAADDVVTGAASGGLIVEAQF